MKKKLKKILYILSILTICLFLACSKTIEPNNIEVLPLKNTISINGKFLKLGLVESFQELEVTFGKQTKKITTDLAGNFATEFNFNRASELIIYYINPIGDKRSYRKFIENNKNINIIINLDENGSLIVSNLNQ